MDPRFTAEDEAFRHELRQFLDQELPSDWNPDEYGEYSYASDVPEVVAFERGFLRKLAERGWLAMAWPREYGGLGASHLRQLIYHEEMAYRAAPGAFSMGVAWVGPALMLYGSEEQKQRYLPPIARGEEVWCTLYSEPGAGSDLAALQTRALLDGDVWVISGQKTWTSGAHSSELGWLAARSDPDAPKHKGISTFIVEMRAPGVLIRPLVNMAGGHGFNEVFFEDVRIPKENLVGEVNRGWYQVAVALDFERSGVQTFASARRKLERLADYARQHPGRLASRPPLRLELAERFLELEVGFWLAYRVAWMQSQGLIPNYEASISKLYGGDLQQRVAATGMRLAGLAGALRGSRYAALGGVVSQSYLHAVADTIAGGTNEIQRNVVATRGLGLPR